MADIIKKISVTQDGRYTFQIFDQDDANAGDILLVNLSIGRDANKIVIEPDGGNIVLQFNVYEQVFKNRLDSQGVDFSNHLPNIAQAHTVLITEGKPQLTVESGKIVTLENDILANDIRVVSYTASSWTIRVS